MPILGITGGVASGKSTFRRLLLERVKAEVFDADACARELLDYDESVRERVAGEIHPDAYAEGTSANRALLREVIYQDDAKKRTLEAILHPIIRERWSKRAREVAAERRMFVVDIPLLFETQAESLFDEIVTVACLPATQLARLATVRGLSTEIAQKIIASQAPMTVKITRANHVVWNDASFAALDAQVELFSLYLNDRYG
jgi:dephospho-CoA kinase